MSHRMSHGAAIAVMLCLGAWLGPLGAAGAEPGEGTMKKTPAASPTDAPTRAPRNKRPARPTAWAAGPTLGDRAAALAWLDGLGPGAVVRLPVAMVRSPLGGVSHATVVGGPLADDARAGTPDGLALELDDGRLGISLADRLRTACTRDAAKRATPCAVWLEGEWRARPLMAEVGRASGLIPFAITRVGDAVEPLADRPLRVYRAAPEPKPEPKPPADR